MRFASIASYAYCFPGFSPELFQLAFRLSVKPMPGRVAGSLTDSQVAPRLPSESHCPERSQFPPYHRAEVLQVWIFLRGCNVMLRCICFLTEQDKKLLVQTSPVISMPHIQYIHYISGPPYKISIICQLAYASHWHISQYAPWSLTTLGMNPGDHAPIEAR